MCVVLLYELCELHFICIIISLNLLQSKVNNLTKENQNFCCIFLGDDCRTEAEMAGKELEDKYRKLQHN